MDDVDNNTILGKSILITGSTGGIGFGIAELLSELGFSVIINGRSQRKLNDSLSKLNSTCTGVLANVETSEGLQKIVEHIKINGRKLDGLVANVGTGKSAAPGTETEKDWNEAFSANLFSTINSINTLKYSLSDNASIVCISSICGIERINGAPITYSVAKAALNHYIKCAAPIFAESKIRINGVVPGNILFPGSTWEAKLKNSKKDVNKMLDCEVPLKRFGTTSEIAEAVAFLLTSQSSFITGTLLTVDGGQTR